jgi:hypothetical protein
VTIYGNKNPFIFQKTWIKRVSIQISFFKWLVFLQRFYNQRVFKLIPEAVNIIKPFRFAWAKERVIDLTVKKELLHELDCLV